MKAGWQRLTLGDVCHVYQPETISQKQMQEGEYPVYGANGVIGRHNQFNHEDPQLILGCRGSCGTVHTTPARSWINGNAMVVKPREDIIDESFLSYALRGGIDIGSAITGAAQPQITRASLIPIPILLPKSLPEQERIVGILDEAFDGIAKAKATAEANLQNARAIFQSHLQTIFSQQGEGWVEMRLDTIAEFSQGIQVGLPDQSNSPGAGLVRFIRIIDYTQSTDDIRYVKDPGARYWASASDIVMVRYGTPGLIGRGIEGVIANNLFKITIINETVTNDFLVYYLGQQSIQKFLSTQGSSTMPALTFKQLGGVSIDFPKDLDKQRLITSKLDTLHAETQRLESLYQKKLNALDELKKSLLHQAFTGNL
jgi:type I restriction enzyme S subunit